MTKKITFHLRKAPDKKQWLYELVKKTTFNYFKILEEKFPIIYNKHTQWQIVGVYKYYNTLNLLMNDIDFIMEEKRKQKEKFEEVA